MDKLSRPEIAKVSPSMIKSVFTELKTNGYTARQIQALSHKLGEMADLHERKEEGFRALSRTLKFLATGKQESTASEEGLFLMGAPEGFEALCLT
jgi:hypothetical protein